MFCFIELGAGLCAKQPIHFWTNVRAKNICLKVKHRYDVHSDRCNAAQTSVNVCRMHPQSHVSRLFLSSPSRAVVDAFCISPRNAISNYAWIQTIFSCSRSVYNADLSKYSVPTLHTIQTYQLRFLRSVQLYGTAVGKHLRVFNAFRVSNRQEVKFANSVQLASISRRAWNSGYCIKRR